MDRDWTSKSRVCPGTVIQAAKLKFCIQDKLWTEVGFFKTEARVHILGFCKFEKEIFFGKRLDSQQPLNIDSQ